MIIPKYLKNATMEQIQTFLSIWTTDFPICIKEGKFARAKFFILLFFLGRSPGGSYNSDTFEQLIVYMQFWPNSFGIFLTDM